MIDRRVRRVVFSMGLVASAALVASCGGCGPSEKTLASLDGPVKVELRFVKGRWQGRGVTEDHGELLVSGAGGRQMRRYTRCFAPTPQLAGDGTALRFAYRCDPHETWTLVYVTGKHFFAACSQQLGAAATPSWTSAPPDFVPATLDILGCKQVESGSTTRDLFEDIATLDDARKVEVLIATLSTPASDGWTRIADDLSPAAKTTLRDRLVPELAKPGAGRPELCRAIALVPEDHPVLRANAPARLAELVGVGEEVAYAACPTAVPPLLRATAATDPKRANDLACKLVERGDMFAQQGQYVVGRLHTKAALAALTTPDPCPAVATLIAANECELPLFADGKACSKANADAALAALRKDPTDALDTPQESELVLRSLLAIGYQKKSVPATLGKRCVDAGTK